MSGMRRRDTSSIHIFWAWFGAGKTHTLYYMQNLAGTTPDSHDAPGLIPIYTEFPRTPDGFVGIYKVFASSIDFDDLADAYLDVRTTQTEADFVQELRRRSLDADNALQVLATGTSATRVIAERWFRGDKVPISDLREAGISKGIATPEDAVTVFTLVVDILARSRVLRGARVGRVVWLLDEFQRISSAPPRVLREINSGLHSAFNSCPSGLSMVLSFSGTPSKDLPDWFSAELSDRIGITKVMILPPLDREKAAEFVSDVLDHHRGPDDAGAGLFPFTAVSCRTIIDWIAERSDLKPRSLMQAFNQVLEAADLPIENGEMSIIDAAFAQEILKERVTLADDEAS